LQKREDAPATRLGRTNERFREIFDVRMSIPENASRPFDISFTVL
jgi:hypothetical protein